MISNGNNRTMLQKAWKIRQLLLNKLNGFRLLIFCLFKQHKLYQPLRQVGLLNEI